MSYNSNTAGTTLANPPILMVGAGLGGKVLNNGATLGGTAGSSNGGMGAQWWHYTSTDSTTAPLTANYFTDAYFLGMRAGDVVIQVGATGSTISVAVSVMGAVTTAGGAYVSTGGQITSTFS